jgi:mono/diheme cytochrome c family protein
MIARQIPLRAVALALIVAVLCALCTPRVSAGGVPTAPEVARGEHIARLICSACHVVATDQEYPPILNQATPSFAEIASRPGVTAESLQRFITATHWDVDKLPMSMPNPMLTRAEAQAVSRYILSLRTR